MKSLLLLALGLARTVVLGARIEAERIVVSVRPYKREQRRCPVCGRACDFYDMANRGAPRLWRAMDLARSACYLEYAPVSVNIFFTIFTNVFSPIAPTRMRRIRQRGCAAFGV